MHGVHLASPITGLYQLVSLIDYRPVSISEYNRYISILAINNLTHLGPFHHQNTHPFITKCMRTLKYDLLLIDNPPSSLMVPFISWHSMCFPPSSPALHIGRDNCIPSLFNS